MSKKDELEKLEEEIKLQELKLKKQELEKKLDTDQKDDELDTNQTKTRSLTRAEYLQIKYPKQSKIVAWGFTGLMGLFILYMAFFFDSSTNLERADWEDVDCNMVAEAFTNMKFNYVFFDRSIKIKNVSESWLNYKIDQEIQCYANFETSTQYMDNYIFEVKRIQGKNYFDLIDNY